MDDRKPGSGPQKSREERLAAALRANLRRRKAAPALRRKAEQDEGLGEVGETQERVKGEPGTP